MKIEYIQTEFRGATAQVSHHGEVIQFVGSPFDPSRRERAGMDDRTFDLWGHINRWYVNQPTELQEAIFQKLKEIRSVFDEVGYNTEDLIRNLTKPIAELIEFHNFKSIQQHLLFNENGQFLTIPADIKHRYEEILNNPGTLEQTYVYQQYVDLITLSTVLRSIYLVWIQFISVTHAVVKNNFKDHFAFLLLKDSKILENPSMIKLRDYVDSCLRKKKEDVPNVVNGYGTVSYNDMVFAMTVVRKVCCVDIRGFETIRSASIIHTLWNFVSGMVEENTTRFGNVQVVLTKNGDDDRDTQSRLENGRVVEEISPGAIAMIQIAGGNLLHSARCLDHTLPTEAVVTSHNLISKALGQLDIDESQVIMAQWIMHSVIPPRGFNHLTYTEVIKCIAISSAWLWHKGHYHIAAILSANKAPNTNHVLSINPEYGKIQFSPEMTEILLEIYEPSLPADSKKTAGGTWKRPPIDKTPLAPILQLAKNFNKQRWIPNLTSQQFQKAFGNPQRHAIPPRQDIADLVGVVLRDLVS